MLSQFQEALLPMLLTGAAGLLVGVSLSVTMRSRRQDKASPSKPVAPAAQALPEAAQDAAAAPAPAAAKPELVKAADLLVVDDSAVARAKLRKLFEGAGYSVQVACDGVEALALLQSSRYCLMVTDLEMPNMDGVALIHSCQQLPHTATLPILAVSGHESLRAKFNECNEICGVHRKPWVDDILLSHVVALIGARRPLAISA